MTNRSQFARLTMVSTLAGVISALLGAFVVAGAADAPRYQVVDSWLTPPAGLTTIGGMHGDIAVSKTGKVYVSCSGGKHPGIQVYSPAGKYLENVPNYKDDFHGFVIAEDSDGEFIIGTPKGGQSLVKFRLDGTEVFKLERKDFGGKHKRLTCVVAAPDGRIFAADGYGNDLIHVVSPEGKYLKSFGGHEAPYGFKTCHKIVVDTRQDPPELLCCDRENRRLVRLSLDGEVLGTIADMKRPAAVAIFGDYAAVGEIEGRVSLLDKAGNTVRVLGHNTTKGEFATNNLKPELWRTGIFSAPHGVAFDAAGNLFVTEFSKFGRVHRFDAAEAGKADVAIADFEGDSFGGWKVEGTAFGNQPAAGKVGNQQPVSGFLGKRLANSFHGGDYATGKLTSPEFKIERQHLNFRIGGGHLPGEACIHLLVNGEVVRTATGINRQGENLGEGLVSHSWDVAQWIGKQATIEIIDKATGGWGHITIDHLVQSNYAESVSKRAMVGDSEAPKPKLPSRQLLVHRRYLRLPIDEKSPEQPMTLLVAGKPVQELKLRLADDKASSFQEVDVSPWHGSVLTMQVDEPKQAEANDKKSAGRLFAGVTQSSVSLADENNRAVAATLSKSKVAVAESKPQDTVSFAHEIQPILTENCFACHGPDGKNEFTSLQLSSLEKATEGGAIVAGDAADSELMARIISTDPDLIMPPPESHKKPLTAKQVDLLKSWINQGANYEKHWSFTPVVAQPIPKVKAEPNFPLRNAIDVFVLEKLRENNLQPSDQEAPHRLIRRLSFDLTGMPPSPELVKRYVANPSEETYAEIVEQLLASKDYGEHWGRHWLDAVRYGDTHGIHLDNYRSIWPYRDWVVKALNDNMPFDQFTIEQIAGDMLPDATHSQIIATGYNRCVPTTNEGGSIPEEVAVTNANDQTATTFGVWQGLTVGCAACHDHKFDPISQKEYYQLTAFFRNSSMYPMDGNSDRHRPVIEAPSDEQRLRQSNLSAKRRALSQSTAKVGKDWNAMLKEVSLTKQLEELQQAEKQDLSVNAIEKTTAKRFAKKLVAEEADQPGNNAWALPIDLPEPVVSIPLFGNESPSLGDHQPAGKIDSPVVAGPFGKTYEISKSHTFGVKADYSPQVTEGFAFGGFFRAEKETKNVLWSKMRADQGNQGFEVILNAKRFSVRLVDDLEYASMEVDINQDVTDEKWHHLMVSYDPSDKIRPLTIYVDAKPVQYAFGRMRREPRLPITAKIANDANVYFGRRDRQQKRGSLATIDKGNVQVADFRAYNEPLSAAQVMLLRLENASAVEVAKDDKVDETLQQLIAERYQQVKNPKLFAANLELREVEGELAKVKQEIPTTMVMEEKKDSTPTAHILERGDYARLLDKVTAELPETLPAFTPTAPKNRLGLAAWVVSQDNPLTARVIMNRYWHYLFGIGIVETTEDFGATGAQPSHPELLNWLAQEFMASDWDLKQMLRTIVTSSTYRQSQQIAPGKLAADPENRLLSRGPRVRLDAEPLRDMALVNSGLLVKKIGGRPVRPYQPEGVWEAVTMLHSDTRLYRQDHGESLYRKSLYTIWKRSAAMPSMTILNAPDRDVFCVRRELTNTPLQAFVMWNDPQFFEAARKVAERVIVEGNDFVTGTNRLGMLFLSREFNDNEHQLLKQTFDYAMKDFKQHPTKAKKVLSVGASDWNTSLEPNELAAWTMVVSQVMNLDEALTK